MDSFSGLDALLEWSSESGGHFTITKATSQGQPLEEIHRPENGGVLWGRASVTFLGVSIPSPPHLFFPSTSICSSTQSLPETCSARVTISQSPALFLSLVVNGRDGSYPLIIGAIRDPSKGSLLCMSVVFRGCWWTTSCLSGHAKIVGLYQEPGTRTQGIYVAARRQI